MFTINANCKQIFQADKNELPEGQSRELCKLIETIESFEQGIKELEKDIKEGSAYEGKKGVKAGKGSGE